MCRLVWDFVASMQEVRDEALLPLQIYNNIGLNVFLFGIKRTSIFFTIKVPIKDHIYPFHSGYLQTGCLANGEDPDELQHNAVFHQGLLCLL